MQPRLRFGSLRCFSSARIGLVGQTTPHEGNHVSPTASNTSQTALDDLPPNVIAAYLEPARKKSVHGVPACQLQLHSYDKEGLMFFADFAMRAAYHLDMPASGPVPMPKKTERWTVPRGPFVHKKTQENFERITYKRMIKISDAHPEVVERWLSYLEKNVMPGVGMKANTFSFETLGVGARMQKARTVAAIEGQSTQPAREIPNLAAEKAKKILAQKEYTEAEDKPQKSVEEPVEGTQGSVPTKGS